MERMRLCDGKGLGFLWKKRDGDGRRKKKMQGSHGRMCRPKRFSARQNFWQRQSGWGGSAGCSLAFSLSLLVEAQRLTGGGGR